MTRWKEHENQELVRGKFMGLKMWQITPRCAPTCSTIDKCLFMHSTPASVKKGEGKVFRPVPKTEWNVWMNQEALEALFYWALCFASTNNAFHVVIWYSSETSSYTMKRNTPCYSDISAHTSAFSRFLFRYKNTAKRKSIWRCSFRLDPEYEWITFMTQKGS